MAGRAPVRSSGVISVAASNAPLVVKGRADYVCTGSSDEITINAALTAAGVLAAVELSGGDFYTTNAIQVAKYQTLRGAGFLTTIHLANNAAASSQVNLIETATRSARYCTIEDICLDGNKANNAVGGHLIFWDTRSGVFTGGIDQDHHNRFRNIWGYNAKLDGFQSQCDGSSPIRECTFDTVQFYRCDGRSFTLHITDSKFDNCTSGHSGLDGFHFGASPGGANNTVTNCKAFDAGTITPASGFGFYVDASQNQFDNCQAQDCASEGFYLNFGASQLSNCLSTRNGVPVSAGGTPVPGFHIGANANYTTLTNCRATPDSGYPAGGGNTAIMSYGYQLDANVDHIKITGCAQDGALSGTVNNLSSGTSNEIDVLGVLTPVGKLGPGANGTFLGTSGGVAAWVSAPGGGGSGSLPLWEGVGEAVPDFSIGGSTTSGPATTPGCKGRRFIMPTAGTLAELYIWLGTVGGNLQACVVDTGDASAGNRSVLWRGSSIATSGMTLNAWNSLGTPALSLTAGQHVELLLGSDNASVRWGAASGTVVAGMATLPSGVLPATGGAPFKFIVQTDSTVGAGLFPAAGGTLAESKFTAGDRRPFIIARIV